jgi:hypothetical protein
MERGLPEMPLLALRVIVPEYVPLARLADVTVTVKVAVEPLAIVTGPLTESQLPPLSSAEGVIVILPEQLPVTLIATLAEGAAGSDPALAEKLSPVGEGLASAHGSAGGAGD